MIFSDLFFYTVPMMCVNISQMHACTEREILNIANNDSLEQLNKILYAFHKHARNLDLVYYNEFSPKPDVILDRLRLTHPQMMRYLDFEAPKMPLFMERLSPKTNIGLIAQSPEDLMLEGNPK